jgi:uncharacterized protein (TIGR02301 family)
MRWVAKRLFMLAFGALWLGVGTVSYAPVAKAQFFNWFFNQPRTQAPRPRAVRPKPPGDDLPPITPRESVAPPPPDDKPYDNKLMRLAEILGAVHYLRELCGADEGQLWRDQMKDILKTEGTTAVRRAKLVHSFNDGYRGYRRTYRTCTPSAALATRRFSTEGANIAASLASTSVFASGPQAKADVPAATQDTGAGQTGATPKQTAHSPD